MNTHLFVLRDGGEDLTAEKEGVVPGCQGTMEEKSNSYLRLLRNHGEAKVEIESRELEKKCC
jgi:hypothetical protein